MQTPILELKNIGKIYVSDNNVSVGIRGVNLSFDRGEFVAVTGKSGSGKSTLLNVISGMDSYEEGELLVEGEPTSHYMQKDWEEYRKQYISFIFQEYNIIESFTVLQNVELALMNIEDPKARRERAMELLRRVGLESHVNHKGSKLSGGQKQRTVIARALAKDSPILLCDEPTGNLDSKSSAEIIQLLREVSKDKLVIIVTHNFEQVENYATRHIRIFDGAVETDHTVRPAERVADTSAAPAATPVHKVKHTLRSGLHLGRVRFAATPKLSVFLCILMTLTFLTMTVITSLTYESRELFEDETMFTHLPGRTVIVRRDGGIITDKELAELATKVGAQDYLHYDNMLDETILITLGDDYNWNYYHFSFGYPAASLKLDEGRYPEAANEVIMEIPISLKPYMGEHGFTERDQELFLANYRVVGVSYYYDNTREPRLLFTEEGYEIASAMAFFSKQSHNFTYDVMILDEDDPENYWRSSTIETTYVDFALEEGTYFVNCANVIQNLKNYKLGYPNALVDVRPVLSGSFYSYKYDYDYGYWNARDIAYDVEIMPSPNYGEESKVTYSLEKYTYVESMTEEMKRFLINRNIHDRWDEENNCMGNLQAVILSPDIIMDFLHENYYTQAYTQASLFFADDREAHDMVEPLRELGYIAVVSDEAVERDVYELIETKLSAGLMAGLWLLAIVFTTLFLSLCSARAMNATRGDVGIMRSMGIPTAVVKISIYVQTLLALVPAALFTAGGCIAIYTIPKTNDIFPFLHGGDYVLVAAVMFLIALNLSRKYVKKMFDQSVKKTLRTEKGGSKS